MDRIIIVITGCVLIIISLAMSLTIGERILTNHGGDSYVLVGIARFAVFSGVLTAVSLGFISSTLIWILSRCLNTKRAQGAEERKADTSTNRAEQGTGGNAF